MSGNCFKQIVFITVVTVLKAELKILETLCLVRVVVDMFINENKSNAVVCDDAPLAQFKEVVVQG